VMRGDSATLARPPAGSTNPSLRCLNPPRSTCDLKLLSMWRAAEMALHGVLSLPATGHFGSERAGQLPKKEGGHGNDARQIRQFEITEGCMDQIYVARGSPCSRGKPPSDQCPLTCSAYGSATLTGSRKANGRLSGIIRREWHQSAGWRRWGDGARKFQIALNVWFLEFQIAIYV
jgi:hypothetical protein